MVISGSSDLIGENKDYVRQIPAVGDVCTFTMELYNQEPEKTAVSFSMLSVRSVRISMDGFRVTCTGIKPADSGKDGVQMTFRAEKYYYAAVSGVRASLYIYDSSGTEGVIDYAIGPVGRQEIVYAYGSAGVVMSGASTFYIGGTLNGLDKEPEEGETYDFEVFLYNPDPEDPGVDFSQISGEDIELTLDGFEVTYDSFEERDRDETHGNGAFLRFHAVMTSGSGTNPGDVDGNGKTDMLDALRILQYLRIKGVKLNAANADVNGNKTVDIQDAMLILQYVCGWDAGLE